MKGRRVLLLLLGLYTATAVGAYVTAGADARSAETKTIASTTTTGFRVVVSATNLGGGGGAPAAAVTVRTFERSGGAWSPTGARRLAGTYFWKTITAPFAVCRLEIRTTAAKPRFRPNAVVQLLRSPSLGCGPASEHELTG